MKMSKTTQALTLSCMFMLSSIGLIACSSREPISGETENDQTQIIVSSEIISLTRDEMIDQADIVFQGLVEEISTTQFNQESGEYWEGGRPFHTITFKVLRPIAGSIDVDQKVTVTTWGNSPAEEMVLVQTSEGEAYLHSDAGHDLQPGDIVIVFANQRSVMWREGKRETLSFVGVPFESYFRLQEDGRYLGRPDNEPVEIEELVSRIAEQRTVIESAPITPLEGTPSE